MEFWVKQSFFKSRRKGTRMEFWVFYMCFKFKLYKMGRYMV